MLVTFSRFLGTPVLSLQSTAPIGRISRVVINPDSLQAIAFQLTNLPARSDNGDFLLASSIREYASSGCIIDSADELTNPTDVVKLGRILQLNFDLIGLKVESRKGSRLGRVIDYTMLPDNFSVQQLIVKRPLYKSTFDPELTIPRTEIVEVTDYKIIVKDDEKTILARATHEDFVPNFVNPFRKSKPVSASQQN